MRNGESDDIYIGFQDTGCHDPRQMASRESLSGPADTRSDLRAQSAIEPRAVPPMTTSVSSFVVFRESTRYRSNEEEYSEVFPQKG